jgi:putative ABC transport system permease protein
MAPLPFAQNAFDKQGQISGIAVEAAEGVSVSDLGKRLDRRLGEGLQAERSESRTQKISGQLQGFKIALLFFASGCSSGMGWPEGSSTSSAGLSCSRSHP